MDWTMLFLFYLFFYYEKEKTGNKPSNVPNQILYNSTMPISITHHSHNRVKTTLSKTVKIFPRLVGLSEKPKLTAT